MSNDNSINIGGNAVGNFNTGGNQTSKGNITVTMRDMTQQIESIPDSLAGEKVELQKLVDQLTDEIQSIPEEFNKSTSKVVKRVEQLVDEISEAEIDEGEVESKVNSLRKAAEKIRDSLPVVAEIATSIIAQAIKISAQF